MIQIMRITKITKILLKLYIYKIYIYIHINLTYVILQSNAQAFIFFIESSTSKGIFRIRNIVHTFLVF